jgi:hypothetical protein
MSKLALSAVLFVSVLVAAPRAAHAAGTTAYLCSLSVNQNNTGDGNFGYAYLAFSAQPSCNGAWSYAYICTAGATYAPCVGNTFTDSLFNTTIGNLQRAAASNQRITFYTNTQLILTGIVYYAGGL